MITISYVYVVVCGVVKTPSSSAHLSFLSFLERGGRKHTDRPTCMQGMLPVGVMSRSITTCGGSASLISLPLCVSLTASVLARIQEPL
jgi:hypothetical protein